MLALMFETLCDSKVTRIVVRVLSMLLCQERETSAQPLAVWSWVFT